MKRAIPYQEIKRECVDDKRSPVIVETEKFPWFYGNIQYQQKTVSVKGAQCFDPQKISKCAILEGMILSQYAWTR